MKGYSLGMDAYTAEQKPLTCNSVTSWESFCKIVKSNAVQMVAARLRVSSHPYCQTATTFVTVPVAEVDDFVWIECPTQIEGANLEGIVLSVDHARDCMATSIACCLVGCAVGACVCCYSEIGSFGGLLCPRDQISSSTKRYIGSKRGGPDDSTGSYESSHKAGIHVD